MAYEKQNFVDDHELTAEQLNHMEDGIENLDKSVTGVNENIDLLNNKIEDANQEYVKKKTSDRTSVYAVNAAGEQILVGTSPNATNNGMIPIYSSTGALRVGNPSDDRHAVPKGYVDCLVGDIETALDAIIAIQNELIGVISFSLYLSDDPNGQKVTYQYKSGMTWREWVESEYNVDGLDFGGYDGCLRGVNGNVCYSDHIDEESGYIPTDYFVFPDMRINNLYYCYEG